MPEPNPRRPNPPKPPQKPQKYVGFEVVDDAEAAPPPRAARPQPRPLPPPPAARPAPPAAKPKPAPEPEFEVVDENDTVTEPAAKAKTTEVRKRPRDEDDDADRPKKKKAKKKSQLKTGEEYADEVREQRLREFEYIWPAVLLVLGLAMTITGALGASGVNGFLTIGVLVVGMVISIPVTIATLMVVGMVVGINYGRFGPAVLKIAAITLVVNGVYFLGQWFKLPLFIAGPIGCAVAFGLFKALFELDNAETNTSMGALNVVTFAAKVVIMLFLVAAEARSERNSNPDDDYDDDPPPTDTRRDRGKWKVPPIQANPGAEPDEPDDPDDPE